MSRPTLLALAFVGTALYAAFALAEQAPKGATEKPPDAAKRPTKPADSPANAAPAMPESHPTTTDAPSDALVRPGDVAADARPIDTCTPRHDEEGQSRHALKHRAPPPKVTEPDPIAPSEMATWPSACRRRCSSPDAMEGEDTVTAVGGDIFVVKLDKDDCDIHLEIGDDSSDGRTRIIAEIPDNVVYRPLRHRLDDEVRAATRQSLKLGRRVELKKPLRIVATGYRFFDGHHACKKDRARGCSHGSAKVATLWELHPVVGIRFAP